ncbi:MAG: hypothetical protein QM605_00570 [Sphingobium sp.]
MLLSLLIAAAATPLAPPKTVNHKVEIDGKTYRVEVKGRTVEVFDKSAFTKRSPEAGLRLKAAVRLATGCEITEEYWEAAHLAGILECSKSGDGEQ